MISEKTPPLVSVIVPMYNMERYIEETLTSITSSEYRNIEVVVVDDGSQDNSVELARNFSLQDPRVKVILQKNGGVCRARNNAVSQANGLYILPVDSDDLIAPWFVGEAVSILVEKPNVKAVFCQGEFFEGRTGTWNLPEFNLHLLARRNMLCITGMYRKEDWLRIGGYNEIVQASEDWQFWIGMLKDGGDVVRIPRVGLSYRIRQGSKRVQDRGQKRRVIDALNEKYPDFFQRELGGPLHYHRSWSKLLNKLHIKSL